VNYYKRHIGDYAAATRHLSLLEHGVYGMLLDVYYTTEKHLPLDERAVFRLVGARTDDEREAVKTILGEFFTSAPDGFHQSRCDEEIAIKQEKSVKNAGIGKLGGRPKSITDSVIPESETLLDESEKVSADSTSRNPSHKPITSNQYSPPTSGKPDLAPCPQIDLIDLFGQHCPTLPQPKPELWEGKSADHMRARWKWVLTAKRRNGERYATTKEQAVDWFGRFFAYVAKSDFLMGRSGDFSASLQWLMKAENFAKVVQGNYENKGAA
jgi:uncharacterized protein YdaU (DUF1376 family)